MVWRIPEDDDGRCLFHRRWATQLLWSGHSAQAGHDGDGVIPMEAAQRLEMVFGGRSQNYHWYISKQMQNEQRERGNGYTEPEPRTMECADLAVHAV